MKYFEFNKFIFGYRIWINFYWPIKIVKFKKVVRKRSRRLRDSVAWQTAICPCGAKANSLHHIDGNPYNNSSSNLKPLCRACHDEIHGFSKK
jgi:hypothetical protein